MESVFNPVIAYIALGISLGLVFFVLAGTGLCAYRYYQRSLTQAGRNREEPRRTRRARRKRKSLLCRENKLEVAVYKGSKER
ncbi:hypothetical protein, partial [Endozoicomonas sp. YOMI1]|uniref:hypothetical protein n=1 Tax=Endozoicomonas sp. YOMI1 TaxID=2828739 RepID=UPI0021487E28